MGVLERDARVAGRRLVDWLGPAQVETVRILLAILRLLPGLFPGFGEHPRYLGFGAGSLARGGEGLFPWCGNRDRPVRIRCSLFPSGTPASGQLTPAQMQHVAPDALGCPEMPGARPGFLLACMAPDHLVGGVVERRLGIAVGLRATGFQELRQAGRPLVPTATYGQGRGDFLRSDSLFTERLNPRVFPSLRGLFAGEICLPEVRVHAVQAVVQAGDHRFVFEGRARCKPDAGIHRR